MTLHRFFALATLLLLPVTLRAQALSLLAQPNHFSVSSGLTATFSVTATGGTTPYSFVWKRGTTVVNGATAATLVLSNVQVADAGSYTVTVTDAASASVTSNAATLTVTNDPPAIFSQSSGTLLANVGGTARLFANYSGSLPVTMQWQRNGVALHGPFYGSAVNVVDLSNITAADYGTYTLEITNAYGTATSQPILLRAPGSFDPLQFWSGRNPAPQPNALFGIAFSSSRYIAVGANGAILSSTNQGASWQTNYNGFPPALNAILYDASKSTFVYGGGFTQLATSPTGETWTTRTFPGVNGSFPGLASNGAADPNHRIVAVGGDFALRPTGPLIQVSSDGGATWTPATAPAGTAPLNSVAFGASRFVAVGQGGRIISSDTTGATWSNATLTPTTTQVFNRVVFSNGLFVAVGNAAGTSNAIIYTSTDGLSFTAQTSNSPGRNILSVAHVSGTGSTAKWIAVTAAIAPGGAAAPARANILTSTNNAVTWTSTAAPTPVGVHLNHVAVAPGTTPRLFLVGAAGYIAYTDDIAGFPGGPFVQVSGSALPNYTDFLNDVVFDSTSSQFIAVGGGGSILKSSNGDSWSSTTVGPLGFATAVARMGTRLLVAGSARIAYSDDNAATWSNPTVDVSSGNGLRGLDATPSLAVAVGVGGTILSSTNGTDWTPRTSGTTSILQKVAHANGRWVAVGGNDSGGDSIVILTSDDGIGWTSRPTGTLGQLWGVAHGNGVWIAAGAPSTNGGGGFILRSLDNGVTWERSNLDATSFLYKIRYLHGVWYATGANSVLATSRDNGDSWTYTPLPSRPTPQTMRGMAIGASAMVIVGNEGTILKSAMQTSSAPVITRQPDPAVFAEVGGRLELRVEAANAFQAAYQWRKNGVVIPNAVDPTYRLPAALASDAGAYDVTITNSNGGVVTSAVARVTVSSAPNDAFPNFAFRSPVPSGGTLHSVVHGGGRFVAVGNGGRVVTSSDGETWTPGAEIPFERARALVFNGTEWLAAGGSSRIYATTSPETGPWTQRATSAPAPGWFNGLAYAGSNYVAVGDSGLIFSSTDSGATWAVRTSPLAGANYNSVVARPGRFVAVGGNGALVTSANAVDWSAVTPPSPYATAFFSAVAFVNNAFVAVGNNGALITSADGVTWTSAPPPSTYGFVSVTHDGTRYLFTDGGGNVIRATALTATASDWSTTRIPAALPGGALNSLAFDSGSPRRYVAVGSGGEISLSTDSAVTWAARGSQGGIHRLSLVRYLDDQFIAVGSNGNVLLSPDARTWRRFDVGTGHWLSGFAEGAGRFVIATEFGDLVSVADGIATTHTVGDTVRNNGIVFAAGRFVVVADGGRVRTSTDGINWTTLQSASTGLTENLSSVVHFNNLFVAVGSGGRIATSPNGSTWTARTSPTTQQLHRVVALDGALFALGENRTVLTSADGIAWHALPSPTDFNLFGSSFRDIAKLHDGYYLVSSFGQFIKTRDFVGYTRVAPLAFRETLSSLAVGAGRVVVTGQDGGALLTAALPSVGAGTTIAVQPRPVNTVNAGNNIVLTVVAHGAGPLAFQWRKDGTDLPGATAATLVLTSTTGATSGSYTVVVTGTTGSPVTSAPALVNVPATDGPAIIVDQPAPATAALGAPISFTVGVATNPAGAPVSYQWRRGGTAITGATNATLTISQVAATSAGAYDVVVTRNSLPVTSTAATLTVVTPDNLLFQQFTATSTENSPARTVHDGAGKVYLPWSVQDRIPDVAGGRIVGGLARFDENTGALDASFRLDSRIRAVTHAVVEPDGRVLVAARIGDGATIFRVSTAGVIDPAFNAPVFARGIRFFTRQSDGKLIVPVTDSTSANPPAGALAADAARIYRLNTNGSVDGAFTPPALALTDGIVNMFGAPVVAADGKVYLVGAFTSVNGTARLNLARLHADGTLDLAFAGTLPAGFFSNQARGVALQSDGRPVFVGDFRFDFRGTGGDPIMALRFNVDGTLDRTFAMPLRSEVGLNTAVGARLRHIVMLPDDSFVAVSDRLYRFFANGARDATFVSRNLGRETFWFSRGTDGRFFVPDVPSAQGNATTLPTWAGGIARFNSDGNIHTPLATGGWGRVAYPTAGAPLASGRVWLGGTFNRFGATYVPGLALFNLNATLAPTQVVSFLGMTSGDVVATDNDKVFAWLETASNTTEPFSTALVRLNPDASLDPSFAPPAGVAGSLYASPGGKLLLAQNVVSATAALNGTAGTLLRRLNANGTDDTTYVPTLSSVAVVERGAGNAVTMIRTGGLNVAQVLPDSRALVIASSIDGNLKVQRLTATGAIDGTFVAPSFGAITPSSGFTPANTTDPVTNTTGQFPISTYSASDLVRDALQMPNGQVYVGGRFALGGTAPLGLVRLLADGTLDATFTGTGVDYTKADARPYVASLAHDDAGRLYVAGRFDRFNGTPVPGLFRLTPEGALDTAWAPGVGLRDAPAAAARLIVAYGKLYVFGTPGSAADALPAPFRVIDLASSTTAPSIAIITPTQPVPGTTVTLAGANLAGTTSVTFTGDTGTLAATFTYDAANQVLTTTVPANARTGPVQVVTPGGTTSLSLTIPLVVTAHGQHVVVSAGQPASLSITVAGGAPGARSFQWRRGGQDLAGATLATYFVPVMSETDVGDYDVRIAVGTEEIVGGPLALRLASPDRWVWRNRLPIGNDLRAVAYGAGRYVALGLAGSIVSSTNGTDWVAQPQRAGAAFNDVAYNGSLFVAVGFAGNVLTSADGLDWTQRHVGSPAILNGIVFGHDKWVAVGAAGAVYTAPATADVWTLQSAPTTENLSDIAPTATGFVAVGTGGYVFAGNAAANTWTSSRPAFDGTDAYTLFDVAVRGATQVATGARRVYVSTDSGATWSNATLPASDPGIDWGGVVADPTDGFVVVGGSFPGTAGVTDPKAYVLRSADAATWTLATLSPPTPGLTAVARGPQGYVGVGVIGQLSFAGTFTGTWSSHATGPAIAGDIFAAASHVDATIAVGSAGTVFRSTTHTDGWTTHNIGNTHALQGAVFAAGKFVVVGGNGNAAAGASSIHSSATAASGSWTRVDIAGPSMLSAIVYDAARGRFVAAGAGSQIYSATDPAGAWTPVAKPIVQTIRAGATGNGTVILAGDNGAIFRSTDGTIWTAPASGTAFQLTAAAFGNGRFVLGGFNNSNTQPRPVILTSTDAGATWTSIALPFTNSIRGLTFADGRFRAVGGTSTILSSIDGTNWTADTSQFSGLFRAVVRTPHGLLAGGTSGMIATLAAPVTTQVIAARTVAVGSSAATPFTPVTASGGHPSYNYFVGPALAAGLTFDSATGAVSGIAEASAATPLFVGADNFNAGSSSKWPFFFRLGGTNGSLDFANARLEFTKGSGNGNYFREWEGDPLTTGTRTSASFATSWVAEVTVTNTLSTTTAGEFATLGLQVSGGSSRYAGLMLGQGTGGAFIKAEGSGAGGGPLIENTVNTSVSSGVKLRLEWNAAQKNLTALYSTNGGTSFTPLQVFTPAATWSAGSADAGFFFHLFGNSNTAAAISSGTMFADDLSIQSTSAATTNHFVSVVDAAGMTAVGTFALTVVPATPLGTISSITPGTVRPGDTITITGTDLGSASSVTINGSSTSFTQVSATEITAVVPPLATTGPVTIGTPVGAVNSPSSLTVSAGASFVASATLGRVGVGEAALLGSFMIEGSVAKEVLIRAAGPTLASLGITEVLSDPVLTIHDLTGAVIATNDDWGNTSALNAAFAATGSYSFPANSTDAAVVLTLSPGTYTARVTGKTGATGRAQIEVAETAAAPRLAVLAARGQASTASPLAVGFTLGRVGDTGNKLVAIRAIGANPIVPRGALVNPQLRLFQGTTEIAANDNWDNSAANATYGLPILFGGRFLGASDSEIILNLAAGATYRAEVGGNDGSGYVRVEVMLLDGYRSSAFKPALLAPLQNVRVALGRRVAVLPPVLSAPGYFHVWKRGGAPVSVSPGGPNAALLIPSAAATHAGTYTLTLTNAVGETNAASFTLSVDAHAADTDGNGSLDLFELSRVIELYNTRIGTVRTGRYAVVDDSEDGFTADSATAENATVSLVRYHSADVDQDGKIDLRELTRVIELYNTRSGTVRTGQYKVQAGTEDGFAAGP